MDKLNSTDSVKEVIGQLDKAFRFFLHECFEQLSDAQVDNVSHSCPEEIALLEQQSEKFDLFHRFHYKLWSMINNVQKLLKHFMEHVPNQEQVQSLEHLAEVLAKVYLK